MRVETSLKSVRRGKKMNVLSFCMGFIEIQIQKLIIKDIETLKCVCIIHSMSDSYPKHESNFNAIYLNVQIGIVDIFERITRITV